MSKAAKYSTMAILLIPIGIAINYVGGQIALILKLPVFIDVIGTILVGALAGPLFGAITGLVTNLILGITAPTWIPYAIVNVAIGIVAGLCAQKGWFKTVKGALITSVLIWLITQLTANPVTVYLFGGVTGSGSSFITSFLIATGQSLWQSVITTALITETVDKFVSVFIVFFIIKAIPARTLLKFPLAKYYVE
ncbi:MAG: ECF transporter S component [Firmicutes bacterium HGW-Firmicutes-10]|jgi:energy-coupling factor transport system substrate-specific component|nr:MAG: ECF transporter S component [Firmicutes bacterium HGW-Firmicutes-19]PKM86633.1 MAG: ECF transporter S component [Firmicutes bacterium HGW-Firmicutes-10]